MLIGHASDLHGNLSNLINSDETPDVWILSGDILPNMSRGNVDIEVPFQSEWLQERASVLADRFGDTPVLVVNGNHDFIDVVAVLRDAGVNAIEVTPNGVEVLGLRFAGFREVPYMMGEWAGECRDFSDLVDRTFASNPDIIITHAPASGILDDDHGCGHGDGIRDLTNAFAYRPHNVRAHFFGHIHAQGGKDVEEMGVHFFNGAHAVRFVGV